MTTKQLAQAGYEYQASFNNNRDPRATAGYFAAQTEFQRWLELGYAAVLVWRGLLGRWELWLR